MAIALEDSDTTSSNGASLVLTPAGGAPASGKVVYIAVNFILNSIPNDFPSSYTLSGFTQKARVDNDLAGEIVLFRKVCGASEPSSYTVTWTGGDFYRIVGSLIVLSGVNTTTPDGTAVTLADLTADSTFSIPALTTTAANSWDLVALGNGGDNDTSASGSSVFFDLPWGSSIIERAAHVHDWGCSAIGTALRASAGTQAATSATVIGGVFSDTSLAIRLEVFEDTGGIVNATGSPTNVLATSAAGSLVTQARPAPPYTFMTITG